MSIRITEFLRPSTEDHPVAWQSDTLRLMIELADNVPEEHLLVIGRRYRPKFLTRLYMLTTFAVDPVCRNEMIRGAKKLLDDGPTDYEAIEKEYQNRIYGPTPDRVIDRLMYIFPPYDEYKKRLEKCDEDVSDTKPEPSTAPEVEKADDTGAYRCVSKGGHIVHLDPSEKVEWPPATDAKDKQAEADESSKTEDRAEQARRRIYKNSAYYDRKMSEISEQEYKEAAERWKEQLARMKKEAARRRSKATGPKWVLELEKEQKECFDERERMRRMNEAFERMLEEDKSNARIRGGYTADSVESIGSLISAMYPEDRELIESLIAFAHRPTQLSCLFNPSDFEHELEEIIKKK